MPFFTYGNDIPIPAVRKLEHVGYKPIYKGLSDKIDFILNESVNETKYIVPTRKPIYKKSSNKFIIIIDAGHGGRDPGAIGVTQSREKDFTLDYALELKNALDAKDNFKVILTREDDYYLTLSERVRKARMEGGDLFISLHADSNKDSSVRGLSVYTLSEKASDKEAARLAARENKEDIIEGVDFNEENSEVKDILIDLMQRDTKNKSSILAEKIISRAEDRVRVLKNPHRFAGFRVLKTHSIPSVLIELGYLSNRKEERNLASKHYKKKITYAISKAVEDYFIQMYYINDS